LDSMTVALPISLTIKFARHTELPMGWAKGT
jgi:hypothetical protein